MDKEEQKEKLTQNIMDAMIGELKKAHADGVLGMECVLAVTMRLTLMVAEKTGCPDPIKLAAEILRSAADQLETQKTSYQPKRLEQP